LWSPDGKQLFYTTAPNNFFAVDIRTEPSFASGKPSKLPIPGIVYDSSGPRNFDITPDGRFVVVIPASQIENNPQRTSQINLVFNWSEELKQRVPRALTKFATERLAVLPMGNDENEMKRLCGRAQPQIGFGAIAD